MKTKKNLLTVFGALAFVAVGAGAYNIVSVSASAEENSVPAITATTEVGFRLKGEYGLRFTTKTDASVYEMLTAENSGVTTGVLVIPTDKLSGELTLETPYVAEGVTYDASVGINEWVVSEDGETAEAYAYLVDIPEMSYTRNLTVRSYYTIGGVPTYLEQTTTSLTCVAQELLALDAEDNSILTDDIATLVAEYVSDYTVVFKDSLTGNVLSRASISADDAKVETPATEPKVEGYEFKGWFAGEEVWDFANDVITGDTLITAKYTAIEEAPLSIDFSQYSVMPAYITTTGDPLRFEEGKLAGYCGKDKYISVNYGALELKAGSTISIVCTTPNNAGLGMAININGEYYAWVDGQSTDYTKTLTLKDDIVLNSLSFGSTSATGATYQISSIVITPYEESIPQLAPLNIDFSQYSEVPAFATSSRILTMKDGGLTTTGKLWKNELTQLSYGGLELKAGSTIVITATATNNGMNIELNGTYYKWINANTTATVTITLKSDVTLNTIDFRCINDTGAIFSIARVVITQS